MDTEAPIFGISRHRINTDGKGVTTLVTFQGCPLRCRYCLNPQGLQVDGQCPRYTPQALYEQVCIDQLYFLSTGGGITFGGGEPCLQSRFIREFRSLCGTQWQINIETSLNVSREYLQELLPIVDEYVVDIKDFDSDIYKKYTTMSNVIVLSNLRWLAAQGKCKQTRVRVPHITGYNTPADVQNSIKQLRQWGFENIEEFEYKIDIKR